MRKSFLHLSNTIQTGVLAGAAGGMAEMAWVSIYAQATGANAASVARGVTTAAGLIAAVPQGSVATGIAIHMALATALGIALALAWRALALRPERGNPYGFALAVLAAVWAMNFLVVLPAIGSDFVTLMPYPVSFVSKLLFGAAAAEVMRRGDVAERARDLVKVRHRR